MAKASKSKSNSKRAKVNVDKDSRVSISKIENGYLVSESGTTGSGRNTKYYDRTYYTPTNPVEGVKSKINFGKKK